MKTLLRTARRWMAGQLARLAVRVGGDVPKIEPDLDEEVEVLPVQARISDRGLSMLARPEREHEPEAIEPPLTGSIADRVARARKLVRS
jgi:hypothetical protein